MEILGSAIFVAIIVLGAMIGIVSLIAYIWDWILGIRYLKYNSMSASNGLTGRQVAEQLLQKNGISDVAVKPGGFWRMLGWGNSYSKRKKTIFMRKMIIDTASVTSTALAAKLVGLALQDHDQDKVYRTRRAYEVISVLGALSFIPVIIVGLVLDWAFYSELGTFTIVFGAIALLWLIFSIIGECFVIKSEDKAFKMGIEQLIQNNLITEPEIAVYEKFRTTYVIRHVLKLVISILELIKLILQIVLAILKAKK